jgi:hypothetical protein
MYDGSARSAQRRGVRRREGTERDACERHNAPAASFAAHSVRAKSAPRVHDDDADVARHISERSFPCDCARGCADAERATAFAARVSPTQRATDNALASRTPRRHARAARAAALRACVALARFAVASLSARGARCALFGPFTQNCRPARCLAVGAGRGRVPATAQRAACAEAARR